MLLEMNFAFFLHYLRIACRNQFVIGDISGDRDEVITHTRVSQSLCVERKMCSANTTVFRLTWVP